jgi:hypothetical protein
MEARIMEAIHRRHFLWYFWSETWSEEYGPYLTRGMAERAIERYCREVLNK